jgi:DNA-binding transcriptional LysR family regulator
MRLAAFDPDVLRSFVAGMDLGSFAKAADCLGRSTSAVSAQMKKLEEQAETPLFRKTGRTLALTDAGEMLLSYARRLLALNDEAALAVRGVALEGWVRFGLQQDFGEDLLPDILGMFARAHPKVRIEARVARNAELADRLHAGQLDFALAWDDGVSVPHVDRLAELQMRWIGPAGVRQPWRGVDDGPVPLVAYDTPCRFRSAATAMLDQQRMPWRVVFTSPNLGGLWAGAAAGLGLTVRTQMGRPGSVRMLDDGEFGLPSLPSVGLVLYRKGAELEPPAMRLATIVRDAVQAAIHHPARAAP